MTKTTEELKREMYDALKIVKTHFDVPAVETFESTMEAYLEALRKAMVTINESTVSCAQHSAEAFVDLEARLARMTEERDILRNKLQAFEFSNRSAAELLSEALRESSGLRKSEGSTSGQSSGDNCSNVECGCCASVLWPSAEAPKPIPMILKMEFDDRVRTLCTACNRSEDVFK